MTRVVYGDCDGAGDDDQGFHPGISPEHASGQGSLHLVLWFLHSRFRHGRGTGFLARVRPLQAGRQADFRRTRPVSPSLGTSAAPRASTGPAPPGQAPVTPRRDGRTTNETFSGETTQG